MFHFNYLLRDVKSASTMPFKMHLQVLYSGKIFLINQQTLLKSEHSGLHIDHKEQMKLTGPI